MKGFKEEMIMADIIEKYGNNSIIQHGYLNKRIYLMKLDRSDSPGILNYISSLAKKNRYTKIFCKVPLWAVPEFIAEGFFIEAHIPRFYNSKTDVFFMSKFLNSDRLLNIEKEKLNILSSFLQNKNDEQESKMSVHLGKDMRSQILHPENAPEIATLYKKVFATYPFPIFNPDYIRKTMNDNIIYFGIYKMDQLVALSSAETDRLGANAEMTDFATDPASRGQKLSVILLSEMEKHMVIGGVTTLYTIARLNSIPMNKTFLKLHYHYGGTLLKNTHIAGKIESMNVYYKHLF